MQPDLALTIKDFCAAFRVGRTLAYKEIARGRLKARKVGARTIILKADAYSWAEGLASVRANAGEKS